MREPKDGGPAFPRVNHLAQDGMTLRDWFAGQALIGWLSKPTAKIEEQGLSPAEMLARASYAVADAMLKERTTERDR